MPVIACINSAILSLGIPDFNFKDLENEVHIYTYEPLGADNSVINDFNKQNNLINIPFTNRSLHNNSIYSSYTLSLVRAIAAKYLNCLVNDIHFGRTPLNKPEIISSHPFPLHFNISYSTNLILIAMAAYPVGVDIEFHNRDLDISGLSYDYCHPEEIKYINESQYPRIAFLTFWTMKEALLKAAGIGITDHLNTIPCTPGEHFVPTSIIESDKNWIIQNFKPAENYIASIALSEKVNHLCVYNLNNISEIT